MRSPPKAPAHPDCYLRPRLSVNTRSHNRINRRRLITTTISQRANIRLPEDSQFHSSSQLDKRCAPNAALPGLQGEGTLIKRWSQGPNRNLASVTFHLRLPTTTISDYQIPSPTIHNKKFQTTKLPRSKRDLSTDRQTKALKNGERHHIADLAILQHNGLIQCLRR